MVESVREIPYTCNGTNRPIKNIEKRKIQMDNIKEIQIASNDTILKLIEVQKENYKQQKRITYIAFGIVVIQAIALMIR